MQVHVHSCINDRDAQEFLNLLDIYDLRQQVSGPTISGNTLDLVITHSHDNLVNGGLLLRNISLADHSEIDLLITFIKCKSIDKDEFVADLQASQLVNDVPGNDPVLLSEKFDRVIKNIVDKYAPEQTKTITICHESTWYTEAIADVKRERGEGWNETGGLPNSQLPMRCLRLMQSCTCIINTMIDEAKSDYYHSEIFSNPGAEGYFLGC